MRTLLALIVLCLLVSCASPLRVGSDLSNEPFAQMLDDEPVGFEVELVEAIAAELGRPVVWERMEFGRLIDAAASGEVHIACATLGITPERAMRVRFTRPYYRTEITVVVPADSPFAKIADLQGQRVGAARGTTSERAVRQCAPGARLVLDRKEGRSLVDQLVAGEIDAAAMDGPDAVELLDASPREFRRLGALTTERYAMAVTPGDTALLRDFDRAVEAMQEDGRIAELLARHGIPPSTVSAPE